MQCIHPSAVISLDLLRFHFRRRALGTRRSVWSSGTRLCSGRLGFRQGLRQDFQNMPVSLFCVCSPLFYFQKQLDQPRPFATPLAKFLAQPSETFQRFSRSFDEKIRHTKTWTNTSDQVAPLLGAQPLEGGGCPPLAWLCSPQPSLIA